MFLRCVKLFYTFLLHCCVLASIPENIGQLPHCTQTSNEPGFVFISTLDGKLSALNSSGLLLWHIDTGPGSLLHSNIHNVELTNNGEWIRIIPSLSGNLYKFNGKTVDAIPITADNLLRSSFFYSHDLVIAGGKEVRTYGVGLHTGNILYECSLLGCQNKTQHTDEFEDVIIIERSTQMVRAHEPRSGNERWNFSVGHHNLKIPNQGCINIDASMERFNVSAILPEGLIQATHVDNRNYILWEYKFESPIVDVWIWDGRELTSVNMFNVVKTPEKNVQLYPAIYLAMHNKQLYIHESNKMLEAILSNHYPSVEMVESVSISSLPWKPVPAKTTAIVPIDDDKSTALSVLYNSEYVNGNGYYLYTEEDIKKGNTLICSDNDTENVHDRRLTFINSWFDWTHILMFSFLIVLPLNIMLSFQFFGFRQAKTLSEHLNIPSTESTESKISDKSESPFSSRYTDDFETVCCLGKGGFGVVFEAKQKIDECAYAIKRITLPKEIKSRDRVLREVKALATLDHQNIVRYFNSWVECPPEGWQLEHDNQWNENTTSCIGTTSVVESRQHRRNNSTIIDLSDVVSFRDEENENNKDTKSLEFVITTNSIHSTTHLSNNISIPNNKMYLYIQMQLCQKESLKDWLFNKERRYTSEIIHIFQQIVKAVDYVHSKGLIHRDLKPSNIFFSMEGDIKVGDFGLVTAMQDCDDHSNSYNSLLHSHTKEAGTHLYMSPEQMEKKKYNFKVDIYSLGIILFELLVPFSTEMERISTLIDLRENVYPKKFSEKYLQEYELLKLMLSKNPDDRPATGNIQETSLFNRNRDKFLSGL